MFHCSQNQARNKELLLSTPGRVPSETWLDELSRNGRAFLEALRSYAEKLGDKSFEDAVPLGLDPRLFDLQNDPPVWEILDDFFNLSIQGILVELGRARRNLEIQLNAEGLPWSQSDGFLRQIEGWGEQQSELWESLAALWGVLGEIQKLFPWQDGAARLFDAPSIPDSVSSFQLMYMLGIDLGGGKFTDIPPDVLRILEREVACREREVACREREITLQERNATTSPDNRGHQLEGSSVPADACQTQGYAVVGDPTNQAVEQVEPQSRQEEKLAWLAKAMLLVREHPDSSDATIAKSVERHPSALSRSREYRAAATMARDQKVDLPRGRVTVGSESGLRDVEAVAQEANQRDVMTDRGQLIHGSKYFQEYCADCCEPMKVPKNKVGTKPVCEDCQN
ncbi:MAG: hypothetical protein ACYC6N_01235 [Pirellulaceae bacterium]